MTKLRIAVYRQNWYIHQNIVYWCNLRVAQRKGLQFYQTRSNAIVFCNTLLAVCIEKVVIRKSGEEFYNKAYQSLVLPQRVVPEPKLHCGRQDTTSFDARTSTYHFSKYRETCSREKYRETCNGEIDFRIQGLPHSTVQQEDPNHKEAVKKLITNLRRIQTERR